MTEPEKQNLIKELINERNFSESAIQEVLRQIEIFEKGIPFVNLLKPCKINDGIKKVDVDSQKKYLKLFDEAVKTRKLIKFVPASGAASRMFKCLLAAASGKNSVTIKELESESSGNNDFKDALEFLINIEKFAFYKDLKDVMALNELDIDELRQTGECLEIIKYTLEKKGLGYSDKPKGSIKFHKYSDGARTAFEEHLVEAVNYAKGKDGIARVHFTISNEHEILARSIIHSWIKQTANQKNLLDAGFSFQKKSTDTIAVTHDNKPIRNSAGKIVFRPGGHGALIENLNELDADIIFIKNIDNVSHDQFKAETFLYKKILCGMLVDVQDKIFVFLDRLENDHVDETELDEIKKYCESNLDMKFKDYFKDFNLIQKRNYLLTELNRPIRVCGMVVNEGHPGGGPFWVRDADAKISKQVVETAQVDLNNPEQKRILESATHFSPVDIVCGIKSFNGKKFELKNFVDRDSGLISAKSYEGKDLKALELPGLWNGGMANWITIFVEVPKITFTPVKEVIDLLKIEHQPTD